MATQDYTDPPTQPAPQPVAVAAPAAPTKTPELILYSRSSFFYWWPIWVSGYIMAALTWIENYRIQLDTPGTPLGEVKNIRIHPNSAVGVTFAVILFLVLMMTNVAVRGVWSVVVLLGLGFVAVLFAWLGWWDDIIAVLPDLAIHANMGFYVFLSTLIFGVWLFTVLVSDRLNFYRVTPGQITYQHVVGGGEKSYDTRGMVFEQLQEDIFRHWLLGFGSGDIRISTTGARKEELYVPNVLFVNHKVKQIQRLIAMKPDQTAPTTA
jgi:hypothetical protein